MSKQTKDTAPKHTPGPWFLGISGVFAPAKPGNAPEHGRNNQLAEVWNEANAARIVACVNNCEGINPEAVPEMLAALKACEKALYAQGLKAEIDREPFVREAELIQVRQALAKAEEGR